MNVNERIKKLRKQIKLSQSEFANRIGITQPSLSDIENGKTENIDARNIKIICAEFNVNEEWLRNGTGEVFNTFDTSFEELIAAYVGTLDDLDRKIIAEYLKMKPEHREIIKRYIKKLI